VADLVRDDPAASLPHFARLTARRILEFAGGREIARFVV